MKSYTKQDIKEFRELMVDNYNRCLALDCPACVDGILYYIDKDGKIVAYGCENGDENTLIFTDLFDTIDVNILNKAKKVKKIIIDKESLDTNIFSNYYIDLDIEAEYALDIYTSQAISKMDLGRFISNKALKSVKLGNAGFIRRYAFCNSSLISINLGKVHTIEESAFENCKFLSDIDLHRVEYIETKAFRNCNNLVYADLSGVEEVVRDTFVNCTGLETIRLSSKCKNVEKGAFYNCEDLKLVEFTGTQKEWFTLSQNIKEWRGGYISRRNRLYMRYV